ncbi:MAG: DNA/RNA nuclease SfsA [Acutalibacter sp.]
MTYGAVVKGTFRARPNRFIAQVDTEEGTQICHVKNTGRCKELLVPGATVYLAEGKNPARKTKYDLVAVEKGSLLINMDSQAPNQVAQEYLPQLLPGLTAWRREQVWGDSRFDLYAEAAGERWFVEVKGVTLEENGVALFPDAPTQRGVKHLRELIRCQQEGYRACALFVVQMQGVSLHPQPPHPPGVRPGPGGAAAQGVRLEAVDCLVTPATLTPGAPVEIRLEG